MRALSAGLCAILACAALSAAEPPKVTVGEIQVVGGTTVTAETVEYYLGVSKGDPYDPDAIAKNFQRFWDSGLVEDLKVESEEITAGKVRVIVTVRERPKVSEFDFKGNKKVSTTTIKEKLDAAGITLRRNSPLRTAELNRFKLAIQEAYSKEGYASAVIEPVVTDVGPNLKKVVFRIDEGVKIKIGEIRFEGNKVFSSRRLRGALKKIKQKSMLHLFGKKLIWSRESWGEDSENLKKFYMNHGYKDIVVGEPRVDLVARNPLARTQKEKRFRMFITIPVQEGKQFRMGTLKIAGATVFKENAVLKKYEVKAGKVYNYSQIELGNEAVRNMYNAMGYIYAYTNQALTERKSEPDVVDVTITVDEGGRFRLGRLEFLGNSKTQDKVLRREFRILEGAWMNMPAFKRSLFKMNQLGYFKLKEEMPEFKFDEKKNTVDVTVKGEEVGRTDIQFGAGYSELDGFFLQGMFNTRNFLGRGETLGLSLQTGKRQDMYSLSFSEPYFLDRPMVVGGSIYKSKLDLLGFYRESKGFSALWGYTVSDFGQVSVGYGYEDVFARQVTVRSIAAGNDPKPPHGRPLPPPYKNMPAPLQYEEQSRGVTSSITPTYGYDSKDDPFDPNDGSSAFARVRIAGGPLGGDFSYFRPEVGASWFHPVSRRYTLAANFEAGWIIPYRSSTIPWYDRYRLGGERSLRGFAILSIVPRKPNGDFFLDSNGAQIWGDRYLQLNLEYQIKLGGPLKFILFTDVGNTYHENQGWYLKKLRYGAGGELRIFLPMFQAPLRFIYGVNLNPYADEKKSDFQFSIGTTF